MIRSFKHKGLELFFETGKVTGIRSTHETRLRMQLAALDSAQAIKDLDIPGYRLHKLKGAKNNLWSITVNRNWRLTFEFINKDVFIVNYEDYH